ncbi:MAG: thioredoxin family protein [Planctomycetes bacterium]|nr:thioredoxin family protein [Planctomycetota bacterium]
MSAKRKIEVFSAGCPVCEQTVELVERIACDSCEVAILDMNDAEVARKAEEFGVKSVPAVVIDGKLAQCCEGQGPDEETLRAAGLGQPIA